MTSHTPQPLAGDDLVARLREGVCVEKSLTGDGSHLDILATERLLVEAATCIEALTSQQHTKPVAGEVEATLAQLAAENTSDIAAVFVTKSSYDALAAAKDAEIAALEQNINSMCEIHDLCKGRVEAAERQRDALREAAIVVRDWADSIASSAQMFQALRKALKDEGSAT